MTYPPSNPTPTAAHARGTVQLRVSLLAVWISKFGAAHQDSPKAMALYSLIAPALRDCMDACGAGARQKQSAAVLRRADYEIKVVEMIRIDEIGPEPTTPDAWASWALALDAIALDAWTTWDGATAACWRRLNDGWSELVEWLHGQAGNPARAERVGMSIYERSQEATGWA